MKRERMSLNEYMFIFMGPGFVFVFCSHKFPLLAPSNPSTLTICLFKENYPAGWRERE
jgi:hypothetical protein